MKFVCAGRLMFLVNCRQFRPVKPIRQPYDGRPASPMNIGHRAILQTADKHIGGIADCASQKIVRPFLWPQQLPRIGSPATALARFEKSVAFRQARSPGGPRKYK